MEKISNNYSVLQINFCASKIKNKEPFKIEVLLGFYCEKSELFIYLAIVN